MSVRAFVRALALGAIVCRSALAQDVTSSKKDSTPDSTAMLLQQAHDLYERVDIERALPLLARVLSPGWSFPVTRAQRVDASTYLAASLVLAGSADSATLYFRRALENDPFTDLDPRRFTPGQLAVFKNARRLTFAVGVRPLSALRIDPRTERLTFTVVTTHTAALRVEVRSVGTVEGGTGDTPPRRMLFQAESDGLREIAWDGLAADGRLTPPGRYELFVAGRSRLDSRADSTRVYFDLRHERAALEDTLPDLKASDLLPERYSQSTAKADLLTGLGVAAGAAVISGVLVDGQLGSRNAALPATVAATATVSGVIAYVWRRHHRDAPGNFVANARRRLERHLENEAVARRNRDRIAQTVLLIAPASGVGP